jgi:hypothetical protein
MLCVKELIGQEGCANASALVLCVSSHYLQPYPHLHVHSHTATHATEMYDRETEEANGTINFFVTSERDLVRVSRAHRKERMLDA